jgi:ketopantoate reductase
MTFPRYRNEHGTEMTNLIRECTQVLNIHYKLELTDSYIAEVIDKTSKNLGWMKGGVRGLGFRNKAIVALGKKYGISTPVNEFLLSKVE